MFFRLIQPQKKKKKKIGPRKPPKTWVLKIRPGTQSGSLVNVKESINFWTFKCFF